MAVSPPPGRGRTEVVVASREVLFHQLDIHLLVGGGDKTWQPQEAALVEAMACGSPGQGNHLEVVPEAGAGYDL